MTANACMVHKNVRASMGKTSDLKLWCSEGKWCTVEKPISQAQKEMGYKKEMWLSHQKNEKFLNHSFSYYWYLNHSVLYFVSLYRENTHQSIKISINWIYTKVLKLLSKWKFFYASNEILETLYWKSLLLRKME